MGLVQIPKGKITVREIPPRTVKVTSIADKIGIEDFQLDTTGSGDKTSVVAIRNITDKLSIHYGFNIFQAINNIMLCYKLSKTIYLETATGAASSLDLFYKKSF